MNSNNVDRGEVLLDAIYDEVDHRLNPNSDECWNCGGDGYTYDCIDGCCEDAESGCELCSRPCPECRIYAAERAKAVREEVIKSGDTDIAIAWLKQIGRWRDGIDRQMVQAELEKAAALAEKGESA